MKKLSNVTSEEEYKELIGQKFEEKAKDKGRFFRVIWPLIKDLIISILVAIWKEEQKK